MIPDAGMHDAGMPDAGMIPDAGTHDAGTVAPMAGRSSSSSGCAMGFGIAQRPLSKSFLSLLGGVVLVGVGRRWRYAARKQE